MLQDNTLSADLFIEQEYIDNLESLIRNKKAGAKILAKTDFMIIDGLERTRTVIEVDVVDYDRSSRLFTCCNQQLNIETTRLRRNLLLHSDPPNFVKLMSQRIVLYKAET